MAKTATSFPSVTVVGDGVSLTDAQQTTNPAAAPPGSFTLANGFNSVPVPAGYTVNGVKATPPQNSAITKTLKGVTGDTGIQLNTSLPFMLTLAPGATAFGITANGIEILELTWY